jgi:hypothetical protein
MDELKTLWRHADDVTLELDLITRPKNIQSVHKRLQDEDRRLKKYLPWTYGFITVMLLTLTVIFYNIGALAGPLSWLGMGLVLLGSWCVAYFSQLVRVPYEDFAYAQPTLPFLYEVKDALRRKRISMIGCVALQVLFLTAGLTLMIFSDGDGFSSGAIGGFLGMMLGIGGGIVGMMSMTFELNYGKVRKVVEGFLADEETLDLV